MSLFEEKWEKFQSRIWLFKYIPFVDFVLAAGSLATGDVHEDSDFDVIVGCRQGRIFTARFSCWFVFGLLGWRKNKKHSKDRICFSHFVTPKSYRLSEPHNEYWKMLYQKLVPVYGRPEEIQKFFSANADWIGSIKGRGCACTGKSALIKMKEWGLSGWYGDFIEKIFKKIQIAKIEKSLKQVETYKPRIIYNDNELEFHPDTKRTLAKIE